MLGQRASWAGWLRQRVWLWPALAVLAATLPQLWHGRLVIDSGMYAGVSLLAWRQGHFWTLMTGAEPYFNKPPLAFWVHGLSMRLFGAELWAMRLPNVLAMIACVWLVVAIGGRLGSRRVGMVAGVMLAFTYAFFLHAQRFVLDYMHTALVLATVWCVLAAATRRRWAWLIGAGAATGLAMMTKPFFALLGLAVMCVWLIPRRPGFRGWLWAGGAALVALAVAAPWHVSMVMQHGSPFVDRYLGREVIGRGTGEAAVAEPWWWYLAHIATTFWPWLALVGLGVWQWAEDLWRGQSLRRHRDRRFLWLCVLWCVVWLVLLSLFADKRDRYMMHVLPMLCLLAAVWWVRHAPAVVRRFRIDWAVAGAVAVSIGLTLLPVRFFSEPHADRMAVVQFIRDHPHATFYLGAGLDARDGGRFYFYTNHWPRPLPGDAAAVPPESYLIEHRGGAATGVPANGLVLDRGEHRIVRMR